MKFKTLLYVMFGLLLFGIGILLGIQIGTYAVIDHVVYGLSGSTFIINLNETKIVDYTLQRFNETILPQLRPEWIATGPPK